MDRQGANPIEDIDQPIAQSDGGGLMPVPSISVVIPCYNGEALVSRAIQSVLDQNYPKLEIIVIDDGSTDDSVNVIQSFEPQIRWESGPNGGACRARNRGLALSASDYVLFLDADDYLVGDYLLQLAKAAEAPADLVIGAVSRQSVAYKEEMVTYDELRCGKELIAKYLDESLQTSAFLWSRRFITRYDGWNESLPIFQDTDFAIRMLLQMPAVRYAKPINAYAVYTTHDLPTRITNTMSAKKASAILRMLQEHRPALLALEDARVNRQLAERLYKLARIAFATSHTDIGRCALREARSLGYIGHPGTIVHRAATMILGLELKTKLTAKIYKVFSRRLGYFPPYPYNLTNL